MIYITVTGFLGKDLASIATSKGTSMNKTSVGCTVNGQTTWFDIIIPDYMAGKIGQYLTKGKHVLVSGDLSVKPYEGRDGVMRTSMSIYTKAIEFIGFKEEAKEPEFGGVEKKYGQKAPSKVEAALFDERDLPF